MTKGILRRSPTSKRVGRQVVSFELQKGDRVVVTGAAGFIGSAVVRALLARGVDVVALLEPGAVTSNLDGLDVERREVDITKEGQLAGAFDGAKYCFHLAAKFGFWPKDASSFYEVNVRGSQNVVRAATDAGVERIVFTSTVATLGLWETKEGRPSTEDDVAEISHLYGNYKQTKYVAEHEVLRLAAQGAPVVLVLPTMPHGPFDHRPTPSGKVVLDYLNGRMPGYVDTAMNVAHVDDLAAGHLLALERGRQGRSYICGGENITMAQLLRTLSDVTGLPPVRSSIPVGLPEDRGLRLEFHRRRSPGTRTAGLVGGGADGDDDDDLRRFAGARRDRLHVAPGRATRSSIPRSGSSSNGYVDAERVALDLVESTGRRVTQVPRCRS